MDEIRLSRGYVPIRAVCGRVFGVDLAFAEPEQIVLQGIRRLEAYLRSIGMPVRLGEAGIDDSRLWRWRRNAAPKALRDSSKSSIPGTSMPFMNWRCKANVRKNTLAEPGCFFRCPL